jgi:hypothetical protein
MSKIALMTAQIYSKFPHSDRLSWRDIEQLSTELDIWRQELPEELRLQNLVSGSRTVGIPVSQKRALMLVHMVYIGTRLLLYQHMIRQSQQPVTDISEASRLLQMPENIHRDYTEFAQQLARVISLLYQDKSLFMRCWLIT